MNKSWRSNNYLKESNGSTLYEARVNWLNVDGRKSNESIIGRFTTSESAKKYLDEYESKIKSPDINWYEGGRVVELKTGIFKEEFNPGDVEKDDDYFGHTDGDIEVMISDYADTLRNKRN